MRLPSIVGIFVDKIFRPPTQALLMLFVRFGNHGCYFSSVDIHVEIDLPERQPCESHQNL